MFGLSKIGGYIAGTLAVLAALWAAFTGIKGIGRDEAELEARDAVRDAEQESANDVAELERSNREELDNIDINRDIN